MCVCVLGVGRRMERDFKSPVEIASLLLAEI